MRKKGIVIYVILFFVICLLPKIGANDVLITADSRIRNTVFQTSPVGNVTTGTDGWLYYKDSLDDYTGAGLLTDRQMFDHAHTMAMFQNFCQLLGSRFLYVCAPNKNTVVPEHMPAYARKSQEDSNWVRLHEFLDQEGVSYLDLAEGLKGLKSQAEGMEIYMKRDSHWSNEGAAYAADAILSRLEVPHTDMTDHKMTVRKDFTGDLAKMVYPAHPGTENQVYYEDMPEFELLSEAKTYDYFDPVVRTAGSGDENAVVYRDSFANSLVPFMAGAFSEALFTRGRPYDISEVLNEAASVVIVERAERFLPDDVGEPPLMSALPSAVSTNQLREADIAVSGKLSDYNPGLVEFTGSLPENEIQTNTRIFVDTGDGNLYEAMPVNTDGQEGFVMYLSADNAAPEDAAGFKVLIGENL